MNKKSFAILSLWTITLCWHLHYYATRVGSPIPATFGVNQDWTRYHIIQTGRLGEIDNAWTGFSSLAGTQNYDLGSLYFAIVNIVTGSTGLVESLVVLNSVQIASIVLLPVIFISWYWVISNSQNNFDFRSAYGMLLLSFFPSVRVLTSGTQGWRTYLIAVCMILFVFIFLPRAMTSKRHLFLLFVFSFLIMNLYHTYVFFFLAICTISVSYYIISQRISEGHNKITHILFFVVSLPVIFYIFGNNINNRFHELITSVSTIILLGLLDQEVSGLTGSSVSPFDARGSDLINASTQDVVFNLNLRRILKISADIMAFSIVILFILLLVHRYINNGDRSVFQDKYEIVIFGTLLSFPLFLIVFYGYGGLLTSVARTRSIAIYFSILVTGLLIRKNSTVGKLARIMVVIWVLSVIIAAVLSGLFSPIHTGQQEQSITHTGSHISDQSYVFSDPHMGMPLLYYDIQGISMITTKQPNWSDSTKKIYFSNHINKSDEMRKVITRSQLSGKGPPPDKFYILISSYPKTSGVPLRSLVTRPTGIDPRDGLKYHKNTNKVYSNGNDSLFVSVNKKP